MSTHFDEPEAPRRLGLLLFLASATVMFIASLVAYGTTRATQTHWLSIGVPVGLWGSTALALLLSVTMRSARRAIAANAIGQGSRRLQLTTIVAAAFLGAQMLNALAVHRTALVSHTLYAATFYMLVGLHAVHVVGGLVPLVVTTVRAQRGEYSSSRMDALDLLTLYWDFLAVVWLVLLAALWLGS